MALERAGGARPIRGVIFDLDGTLIDSREDIARAVNHALARHGFAELPLETISGYVGDGAVKLLESATGLSADDPSIPALYASFIDYYAAHPVVTTQVFPGVFPALDALSGLLLSVCTNKPRLTTDLILRALELTPRFRAVVAGDDLPRKKPDPLPIVHLAERLGLPLSELVVVGDGAQDIAAGRAAGVRTIGVRHGIQPLEKMLAEGPDQVIGSLLELPALLKP
jgi:2-phosphoglycolate phosphatase